MSQILRILDANLNRAREGIRVIEEWCRFGLNDSPKAETCKKMRQELATWHTRVVKIHRDTPGDIGTELSHPQEETRQDLSQILHANLARVQEALRVLEEYGKLSQVDLGKAAKQMRYQIYTIESEILGYERRQQLDAALLYLITSPQPNLVQTVDAALKGGLSLVQYRNKNDNNQTKLQEAKQLRQLCSEYNALFIVNDHIDLALAVQADGVHLGQQDYPVSLARQILGPQAIVGMSTTSPQEMAIAIAAGADYIGVGPVHQTPTKKGKAATGLEYIRYAVTNAPMPWYAIGGIDADNVEPIVKAGGKRVAVVRAIMEAENPTQVTQIFLEKLSQ